MNPTPQELKQAVWDKSKATSESLRQAGIDQFINVYNKQKNRDNDSLKFGDEVEYSIIKFDHKEKKVRLCTKKRQEIFKITDEWEKEQGSNRTCLWKPEYASYMIESTPGRPYGEIDHSPNQYIEMEKNLKLRREEMKGLLDEDETIISLTSFPSLGCHDFLYPKSEVDLSKSLIQSIFIPEDAISYDYLRFKEVQLNIDSRRGRKMIINRPIFKDLNTPSPFVEEYPHFHEETKQAVKPDHIYLDAMIFGMGASCLQVTFQAKNLNEAKHLYDQLTPLTPILLALSAAAPIFRGYLSDLDCRWSVICSACDDRTRQEKGEEEIKFCDKYKAVEKSESHGIHRPVLYCECGNTHYRNHKSRFNSVSCYLSDDGDRYNDVPLLYRIDYYKKMVDAGVDQIVARHVAHLFIRDAISPAKAGDDEECNECFDNIQSTNWQAARFKVPPTSFSPIGFRVEFRTLDLQITDFENSAYAIFIILLTRVILEEKLDLLVPISKVDENFVEAEKNNAVLKSKFWFRKDIHTKNSTEYELMTLNEIMNGKNEKFPGLISYVRKYVDKMKPNANVYDRLDLYLNLISDRASGACMTDAQWMRKEVRNHPDYKFDSKITDKMVYDLLMKMDELSNGLYDRDLFGNRPNTIEYLTKRN